MSWVIENNVLCFKDVALRFSSGVGPALVVYETSHSSLQLQQTCWTYFCVLIKSSKAPNLFLFLFVQEVQHTDPGTGTRAVPPASEDARGPGHLSHPHTALEWHDQSLRGAAARQRHRLLHGPELPGAAFPEFLTRSESQHQDQWTWVCVCAHSLHTLSDPFLKCLLGCKYTALH